MQDTCRQNRAQLKISKCALLCVILGAHFLLFSLISVNDNPRGARRPEEPSGILLFVELAKPDDTQPSTQSSSKRPISTYDSPPTTITLPPEIVEGADARIDWYAEAARAAGDVIGREREKEKLRSLDQHPSGMGPLPPKPSRHKLGDSEHFEGGVIIDWTSHRCYYSNQDAPIPAFGQALRLQLPTCTGAGGGDSLPSLEDWKKEQANR